jgi:hypothetical protein
VISHNDDENQPVATVRAKLFDKPVVDSRSDVVMIEQAKGKVALFVDAANRCYDKAQACKRDSSRGSQDCIDQLQECDSGSK